MKCCAFVLILGSLFVTGHSVYPAGSCDEYENITDPRRNKYYTSSSFLGYSHDDGGLLNKWWRFTGLGGDRVITECTVGPVGGFSYAIRVPFVLPVNESETATDGTAYAYVLSCDDYSAALQVVLCPGGFYIYKPTVHPHVSAGYVTYHSVCTSDSCGPLAECVDGGCSCVSGYEMIPEILPTVESYGCVDIDECVTTSGICGPYAVCTNEDGSYSCACIVGYEATDPDLSLGNSNPCIDIDECKDDVCGRDGKCTNNAGSFVCTCNSGFLAVYDASPVCQDINECIDTNTDTNSTICGPVSICLNNPGLYQCKCQQGYEPTTPGEDPSQTNICTDIDECTLEPPICGPDSNCTNQIGAHACRCHSGYRRDNEKRIASVSNPCLDIDECIETEGICGISTVCTNVPGTFLCSCPDGFYPSTGIVWTWNITFCKDLQVTLNELELKEGETQEQAFLGKMGKELVENNGIALPAATVTNSFAASMEVCGVGPRARSVLVSSEGNAESGSTILELSDRLVSAMVTLGLYKNKTNLKSPSVELTLQTIEPGEDIGENALLSANGNTMEINLDGLARNNQDSAAAAFLTLNGMESLLSHQYFHTENKTEMYSDVVTAVLPMMNVTNLTEAVNFTIYHKKTVPEPGMVTCVYWEDKSKTPGGTGQRNGAKSMRWSVDGCSVAFTNENFTICSCTHLSTFALILQIAEPPPDDAFLEWMNRVCVIVGLFFFGLAIMTFLLCSWNPKINNTARLHLCISLGMTHLLMLWNDHYLDEELACTVMAGLLHFLVIASFVWMLLEAFQLYLLVRRLSKVQVIQRDGLPKPLLYVVGYGVPFVIVGVSALIFSDGYGATAGSCWLSTERSFNWALTGPVVVVLAFNCMLFGATLWSLKPTLANMKSDVSQSKDTRLILFKILAQFVILGCTWLLGLYQSNLFFQVLFILLNSQQGTFLFIVHCVLNKEVREEYVKWLTCAHRQTREEGAGGSVKDAASVSEDWDKAEEQKK